MGNHVIVYVGKEPEGEATIYDGFLTDEEAVEWGFKQFPDGGWYHQVTVPVEEAEPVPAGPPKHRWRVYGTRREADHVSFDIQGHFADETAAAEAAAHLAAEADDSEIRSLDQVDFEVVWQSAEDLGPV